MGSPERPAPVSPAGPPSPRASAPTPEPSLLQRLAASAGAEAEADLSRQRRAAMRWLGPVCLLLASPILAPALLADFAMSRRWGRVGPGMTFLFGFLALLGSYWFAACLVAAAVLFVVRWPVLSRGIAFGYSGLVVHTLMLGGALLLAGQLTQMGMAIGRAPTAADLVEVRSAGQLASEAPLEGARPVELVDRVVDWDQGVYCAGAPDATPRGASAADLCAREPLAGAMRWAPLHGGRQMIWVALPGDATEVPAPLYGVYHPRPVQMVSVLALLRADVRRDPARFGVLVLDLAGVPSPSFLEAHPPAVLALWGIGLAAILLACGLALREAV